MRILGPGPQAGRPRTPAQLAAQERFAQMARAKRGPRKVIRDDPGRGAPPEVAAGEGGASSSPVTSPAAVPAYENLGIEDRLRYQQMRREMQFALWRPYPKQLEFFAMGATKRERLLRAGNQVGKTTAGAFEMTCHLTGRYPSKESHGWEWPGKRFDRPVLGWIGGLSGIAVRDAAQTKLLGTPGDPSSLGTGMVPKDLISGSPNASRSAPNGVDSFLAKHITGANSRGVFKTYEQGAGFWQGPTVDVIWADEEDPMDVHNEALARLTGDGIIYNTLSPLLGRSLLLLRFLGELDPDEQMDRGQVVMTLADAEHFSADEKRQRRASYAMHERAAREFGEPTMGEGNVFTVPEKDLRVNMSLERVPNEWAKLWSIDFGGSTISNHAFAAVLWGFDLEDDIDYVLHCIKMTTPPGVPSILSHCDAMKRVAAMVPVAWPHDGHVTRDGEAMSDLYKQHGLVMLPEHAQFASGGYGTIPGINALDQRMQQRKLLVRNSPENEKWFEEYRVYHWAKDTGSGRKADPVKEFDDLMSATRIGFIMKRKARVVDLGPALSQQRRTPPVRDFDLFTGLPIMPGVG